MKSNSSLEEKIGQYLLGKLSPAETLEVERAMREDTDFASEVELRRLEFDTAHELIADDIRTLFQRLREQEPESGNLSPRWGRQWYYYAAAACVAALVFWLFFNNGDSKIESDLTVVNLQPPNDLVLQMPLRNRTFAPPEQVAEVPPKTRPIPRSKIQPDSRRIALAKNFYDKSLNDNVASAFRGSSGAGSQDAVDRAIASWQNKDYREVIRQLNAVGPEHPRYYTAQLLLAHANFRTGRYEAAATAARVIAGWKVKRNESYVEEAEWLLVLSLLAGGKTETEEFRSLSKNISEDKGHPSYDQTLVLLGKLYKDQSAPVAQSDSAFTPHPSMEAFVVSSSRSQGLKVKIASPQNDTRFVPDTNGAVLIHFVGTVESTPAAPLELRIFDNKQTNKPLLSVPLELKKDGQAGTQTFDLGQQLKVARGLYYFTIGQQGLTPAYAGRFVIRN